MNDARTDLAVRRFLAEFDDECFPRIVVPSWIPFDGIDPPFPRSILRAMRREGVIELDERGRRFRLTFQAELKRLTA